MSTTQLLASAPQNSAKVSANAGTGKTHVLTRRVLRLMLANVHPSRILCLTYTKAAAAEMIDRVSKEMRHWATIGDAALVKELTNLVGQQPTQAEITRARELFTVTLESTPPPRIQTIHSFCQEILRRFPLEAGITPNFEVIDDTSSFELIKEAKTRLLLKEQVAPVTAAAVDYITNNSSEKKFNDIVSEIISARNRLYDAPLPPEPNGDANEIVNNFLAEKKNDESLKALMQALCNSGGKDDTKCYNRFKRALEENHYNSYFDALMTVKREPRAKIATKKALDFMAHANEAGIRLQNELQELEERICDIKTTTYTWHTYHLAKGLLEIYDNLKKNSGWLDYNDLLYLARKLLTTANNSQWVLYKLDGGIDHLMVDEAQDTSPEQWEIIEALTAEFFNGEGRAQNARSVFIVGDEKQSIYSFQGAEPAAFNAFTKNISARVIAAGNSWHEVPLQKSFRSTASVLTLVDEVFAELITAINPEAEKVHHELHRTGHAGRVELWPIIKRQEKPDHELWHLPTEYYHQEKEQALLAEKIATTVKSWLSGGRKLESQGRDIIPSDILIILRRRGDLAELVIKKLKELDIPVSGADRLKLAEHIAAQDLVALGKFLLLPQDDLNLACLLKSPLFGVTEEELFQYCHYRKEKQSLWDNLPPQLRAQLTELLSITDFYSVYELYSHVLDKLEGRKKFISRLGTEVNDVLDEFLEMAVEFESNHANSLQKFLHWFNLSATEIKRDMEQNGGQVRVMTVHASKGLQAPIVFIADATSMSEQNRDELMWNDESFMAAESAATASRAFKDLKEKKKNADHNEYLRLLYVAMTRSEDELYICGTEGERRISDKCWYNIILPTMLKLGQGQEDGSIVINNPQTAEPINKAVAVTEKNKITLPSFIHKKLNEKAEEVRELDREFDAEAARRGRRIHKQLEHSDIFPGSIAEVPVIGHINGKLVHGRIDRLWFKDDEIHIIDFKTHEPVNTIPGIYKQQLAEYAELINLTNPGKKTRKFIYWTEANRLDEVLS